MRKQQIINHLQILQAELFEYSEKYSRTLEECEDIDNMLELIANIIWETELINERPNSIRIRKSTPRL